MIAPDDAQVTHVSGDWEWFDPLDAYETAYAVVSYRTNAAGFAVPVVTEQVMAAIIARQAMLDVQPRLAWDGNGVLVTGHPDHEGDAWLMPDDAGHFDLGLLGWAWQVLDSSDYVVRRIA